MVQDTPRGRRFLYRDEIAQYLTLTDQPNRKMASMQQFRIIKGRLKIKEKRR
jgi:hypothetical protein